jgi:lysine biosynthesis protein LysW
VGTCLDCDTNIDLDEGAAVGDAVMCPKCKANLEIIGLSPVILDYAVDEDEIVP